VDSLSLLCVIANDRLVLLVGCVGVVVVVVVVDVSGVGVTYSQCTSSIGQWCIKSRLVCMTDE